ncbi:MAG: hypothetical protein Q4Q03_01420 [Bowdeniella nasicola]|nr:hypothetical protein [Bowdeniella nasicola]
MMRTVTIIDHLTGNIAVNIDSAQIHDAVQGWREHYGLNADDLRGVEVREAA